MKINTSAIEGFEKMSAEEKLTALLGLDFEPEGYRSQAEFDRIMSENKQKKDEIRKLREELNTGNSNSADLEKRLAELEKQNATLARDAEISSLVASFTKLGYSEDLAKEAATASADKNLAKVLEIQTKFQAEHDKTIREEALKGMRKPGGGQPPESDKNPLLEAARSIGKEIAESTKADGLSNYLL